MFLGVNSSIFVVVLLLSKTTSLELLFTFACCYHYLYCFFKGLLIGILDCVCACGGGGGGVILQSNLSNRLFHFKATFLQYRAQIEQSSL